MKEGRKKSQVIPPLSVANFLKLNNKQRRTMIGDDTLQSISSAMKVVEQGKVDVIEKVDQTMNPADEQILMDKETVETSDRPNADICEKEVECHSTRDEIVCVDNNQILIDKEIEETLDRICRDDVCDTEDECHLTGDVMVGADHGQITLGKTKKTRGTVYCRKLTALGPGEKIFVEFNADGILIGQNASIFVFFLGEQVRNRAVFPIQVNGWEEFKEETLDHLWSCIMEKFDFDHPDLRRESVMKHARSLFRDSRYKLRRKYILEPNLTSKEDQLKNKPKDMLKADWKYLVELWRTPKFQEKSTKGKENRSLQKMPHYTGTKSHARVKEELGKKLGRECSRVDILLETRKRKSTNRLNPEKLACNMHAIKTLKRKQRKLEKKQKKHGKMLTLQKKEAEAIRNEVDIKIAANNELWEDKLVNLLKTYGIGAQRMANLISAQDEFNLLVKFQARKKEEEDKIVKIWKMMELHKATESSQVSHQFAKAAQLK
ncbi:hypothetical protein RND81_11G050300 [Saponaria officinalis]|uniref:Transposase n=1 Tax=Saponaria officinalis TaxID=3572 RepID=A0AAW1HJP5_SAPOF